MKLEFSNRKKCPKCGSKKLEVSWCPGGYDHSQSGGPLSMPVELYANHPRHEHLDVECDGCSFEWLRYCAEDSRRSEQ